MNEDVAGHRERLRKKYSERGFESLHDYEQLELILTYIIPRRDVKPIAKELLRKFTSIDEITRAAPDRIEEVGGVGKRSALFFKVLGDNAGALFKGAAKKRTSPLYQERRTSSDF